MTCQPALFHPFDEIQDGDSSIRFSPYQEGELHVLGGFER